MQNLFYGAIVLFMKWRRPFGGFLAVLAILPVAAFAADKKQQPNMVISKSDPALAVTAYYPSKFHEVKTRYRLAFHTLKVAPFAVQSFDRTKTTAGIRLTVTTSWSSFRFAPILVVADGKTLMQSEGLDWSVGGSWNSSEETVIEDADLLRNMAVGKEVYVTVILLGNQAPFDRISFKLSTEQLNDCRLLVAKYGELEAAAKGTQ
jgi:hypothetical protein